MKITAIAGHTLVGFSQQPPVDKGNCFTAMCDDGMLRSVLNFGYENVEALLEQGLTFPIEATNYNGFALVDDIRIGERWYRKEFCVCCCPEQHLPLPQKMRCDRQYRSGAIKRHGTWLEHDNTIKPQFP